MPFKKVSLILLLVFLFGFIFSPKPVLARENFESFVTIVNPVRGQEFWSRSFKPLDTPQGQYKILTEEGLPATWLLRYDAISDPEISSFFKSVSSSHELGIFFEITPNFAQKAGVTYNQSESWHRAKSVLLTGYSVEDRQKLITTAFEEFKKTFGYYPKSVGAWWIDANSLTFMKEKYGIKASMVVADQFSTDDYQVWGLYWSTPYYPSKKNGLTPAQTSDSKIDVVQVQWAPRDPFNGYGPGVQESTYSVQVNDYSSTAHNLDISYFEKLFDIYTNPPVPSKFGQITIGLENDFTWDYGNQYKDQLLVIKRKANERNIRAVTMSQFADWYRQTFPDISPPHLITSDDPLGSGGKVVWYMTPYYRVGWFYHPTLNVSAIRDLRLYNDSLPESCYATACSTLDLGLAVSKPLDEATFGDRWTLDEGAISNFSLNKIDDGVRITYYNQAGKSRTLEFRNRDLFVDGEGIAVSAAIIQQLSQTQEKDGKITLGFESQKIGKNWLLFFGHFWVFLSFSLLVFVFPGIAIFKKLQLKCSALEKVVVCTIFGIAFFAFLTFILGYLKIRFLVWPVLLVLALLAIKDFRKDIFFKKIALVKKYLLLSLLLFLGTLSQGVTVFKNGLPQNFGLGFWGPNGHDAIWHLSIISELKNHFPPQNPVFAGELLKNYHYFSDLVVAQTASITQIPILDLYFRFFPAFVSLLFGLVVFVLARQITRSEPVGLLAVFLSYFGGSFGWLVTLLREGKIGGESMFWANQAVSFNLNPPFAFSALMLIAGLFLFFQFIKERQTNLIFPLAILWGSLVQFKAYAAVLVLIALGSAFLFEAVKKRFDLLKLLIPIVFIFILVFLPIYQKTRSLFVFSPFWFIHTMADYQDRLFWPKLSNARTAYIAMGWWWKLILAEILGFLIFFFGNLGTRFLALGAIFIWAKSKFKVESFWLFLTIFSLLAIIIPLLFIQKGTPWNTIQFFYYFLLMSSILAAWFFWGLIRNWKLFFKIVAIVILVVVTIPTTLSTAFYHYLPQRSPARLSFSELEALEFLKNQPEGVVLAKPFDENLRKTFDLPLPLYVYETSAYISAFSEKREFVADLVNLNIIDVDFENRLAGQKEFFKTRDEKFAKKFLEDNKIKYLYVTKFEKFEPDEQFLSLKKLFENDEVKIYQVL